MQVTTAPTTPLTITHKGGEGMTLARFALAAGIPLSIGPRGNHQWHESQVQISGSDLASLIGNLAQIQALVSDTTIDATLESVKKTLQISGVRTDVNEWESSDGEA